MPKRLFYSHLFDRPILSSEKEYYSIVKAEVLFQIDGMKKFACQCPDCKKKRDKLLEYYNKHILGSYITPHD